MGRATPRRGSRSRAEGSGDRGTGRWPLPLGLAPLVARRRALPFSRRSWRPTRSSISALSSRRTAIAVASPGKDRQIPTQAVDLPRALGHEIRRVIRAPRPVLSVKPLANIWRTSRWETRGIERGRAGRDSLSSLAFCAISCPGLSTCWASTRRRSLVRAQYRPCPRESCNSRSSRAQRHRCDVQAGDALEVSGVGARDAPPD